MWEDSIGWYSINDTKLSKLARLTELQVYTALGRSQQNNFPFVSQWLYNNGCYCSNHKMRTQLRHFLGNISLSVLDTIVKCKFVTILPTGVWRASGFASGFWKLWKEIMLWVFSTSYPALTYTFKTEQGPGFYYWALLS